MIGFVFTALVAFAVFMLVVLFFRFVSILFLIFLIMACFKVGTLMSYIIILFAGLLLFSAMYTAVWGSLKD